MNLTFEEYKDISSNPMTTTDFEKYIKSAVSTINMVTRYFYDFNNFEDDVPFRKKQVKLAIACQVDYFSEMGATTHEALNNKPQSISLGRTTITQSTSRNADNNRTVSTLSHEALQALHGTGLLNRGVL